MYSSWELSEDDAEVLHQIVRNDDVENLSNLEGVKRHINDMICTPCPGGYMRSRLFFTAVIYKATRCVKWMLQNGADPNLQFFGSTALANAFRVGQNYDLLIAAGARLEFASVDWLEFTGCSYISEGKLALYHGVCMPKREDNPHIPPVFYDTYERILAREAACRRACYAVLLYFPLPKDLKRWMLQTFVFPSRREDLWEA